MKKYGAEKREEALKLFMESKGILSQSRIADKLGINRKTVAEWRKEDEWDSKLSVIGQMTAKKTAEKISDQLSDEIAKHFRVDMEHLDILDKLLFMHLFERDASGNPVRGSDGLLRPNSKLDPMNLKRIADARSTISTTRRMILGLPTSHAKVDQNVKSEVHTKGEIDVKVEGASQKILEIIQEGDPDRMKTLQDAMEKYEQALFGWKDKGSKETRH